MSPQSAPSGPSHPARTPHPRVRFLLALAVAPLLTAQSPCPSPSYQGAASISLKPSATTHLALLRQPGGSYTGFEFTNASPYRIIRTTPNFQTQLTGCPGLPADGALAGVQPPEIITRLDSGAYLWVRTSDVNAQPGAYAGLIIVLFDRNLQLVSEAQYPVGIVETLAIADVNGDGLPDILTGTAFPHNSALQVLLGAGGSNFQPPATYNIPSSLFVYSMALADLNGDRKLDVVIASTQPGAGRISVFLGNGDGTFQSERVAISGSIYPGVAIGDLNRDGKPDLACTIRNDPDFGYGPSVAVMMGAGDGTFGAPVKYPAGWSDSVAIADIDGDGSPDLLTSGFTIWFNDGQGRFSRRLDYWQEVTGQLFVTDFDGDGKLDVVTGTGSADALVGPSATVLFGRGSGAFAGPPVTLVKGIPDANNGVYRLAAGDLDGDSIPDLVVQQLGRISILKGRGDGTFRETFSYTPTAGFPTAIAITDMNRDGKPDIVVAIDSDTRGRLEVLPGRGDGTFLDPIATPAPRGLYSLSIADFNGDGRPDAAVLLNVIEGAAADRLLIFLGNGAGGFAAPASYTAGVRPPALAVGDFNRDGKPDIAIAANGDTTTDGGLYILFGNGDGTFSAAARRSNSIASAYGVATADFNHDGNLDLAVTVAGLSLLILPGNGDGTFRAPAAYPVSESFTPSIADLNGDGIPDILNASRPSWLIANGDGTFQPEVYFAANAYPFFGAPVAADFNRDGKPDLAGGLFTTGVTTLLNISQTVPLAIVNAASFAPGPLAPDSLATAFGSNLPANATVTVSGAAASILYASGTQINFLVPPSLPAGPATVTIGSLSTPVTIAPVAPAIFPGAYLVVRVRDGQQTIEPVTGPIDLGPPGDQVYLSLFGTGIRAATQSGVTVRVQGIDAPVSYAGPQPNYPGLDQVNILLSRDLIGTGDAALVLTASTLTAPTVHLTIR